MKILQFSSHDHKGGAARIAWSLYQGFQDRGHQSQMVVGFKSLESNTIFPFDNTGIFWKGLRGVEKTLGLEKFNYPGIRRLFSALNGRPDVVHAHNLHGGYFDLRKLPELSRKFPLILTLHDNWLFTGHCGYFIDCQRWKTGCGKCPYLSAYPAISHDLTAINYLRKKRILDRCQISVATPSTWLMDLVKQSYLKHSIRIMKVIPNGVDLNIFRPKNKAAVRNELGLPTDAIILLFVVASGMMNSSYKDYNTINRAIDLLQAGTPKGQKIVFLGLRDEAPETQVMQNLEKRFIPYQKDINQVAKYYQAADIYLHAARADTFPTVIIEALACGTPVVATNVGGISEQVCENENGLLTPAQDHQRMADCISELIVNENRRQNMAHTAAEIAQKRFGFDRMVDDYLDFYRETIAEFVIQKSAKIDKNV